MQAMQHITDDERFSVNLRSLYGVGKWTNVGEVPMIGC